MDPRLLRPENSLLPLRPVSRVHSAPHPSRDHRAVPTVLLPREPVFEPEPEPAFEPEPEPAFEPEPEPAFEPEPEPAFEPEPEPDPEASRDVDSVEDSAESTDAASAPSSPSVEFDKSARSSQLKTLKINELRKVCRGYKLTGTGTKATIISRIVTYESSL
jgi:hypothetical protein